MLDTYYSTVKQTTATLIRAALQLAVECGRGNNRHTRKPKEALITRSSKKKARFRQSLKVRKEAF